MNVTPGETRIAKLESGILYELSIERDSDAQVAGNIYLGRITRVLPGMQAAFVDIGLEKAAFLYVADIVPDLFEGIDDEDDEEAVGEESPEAVSTDAERWDENEEAAPEIQESSEDALIPAVEQIEELAATAIEETPVSDESSEAAGEETVASDISSAEQSGELTAELSQPPVSQNNPENTATTEARNPSPQQRGSARYARNDRRIMQNRGRPKRPNGGRKRRESLPRIEDVVKEGQMIVVQVAKEPIRTKGARITSHISLPGRYLVFMPTVNHVGVSRRIGSFQERQRLKKILYANKPSSGGFIARTISTGVPEDKLVEDMNNLKAIWQKIYEKQEKSRPPCLLHADLDIVMRSVRDSLSDDIDRLVIDSKEDYNKILDFVGRGMPELCSKIELYDRDTPLFDVYGIETEISRALSKKVWLKSGGYLIIDQSEALTAIDVNTGRFVGKRDFDETIVTTNLEAVDEITYQLKLRSIGGIVIIDFIDMSKHQHRLRVYNALKGALRRDRVKTTISKISELGLIEMTRKRVRESLTQMLSETCYHCKGTGAVKTPLTVAFDIFREIKRVFGAINSRTILVNAHPRVAKVLYNEGRERLEQIERLTGKRIVIEPDEKRHVEEFEIRGRDYSSQN